MKIIFLDYDGVVNTLIFEQGEDRPRHYHPQDGKVNNYQAICWLNKLCKETKAKIVVTSTWRRQSNYRECLYNGGLDKSIDVIGRTSILDEYSRADEIYEWLNRHRSLNIENFVIIDDETAVSPMFEINLVKCDPAWGFGINEYSEAKEKLGENKWKSL